MLNDKNTPPAPENAHHDDLPEVVPPLPRESNHARNLPWRAVFDWLRAGWADMWNNPLPSLMYGFVVFAMSAGITWFLFQLELDYALFPALAGFMVIGPLVANGLYEKSRRLEAGERTNLLQMIFVKPRSGPSALFMGVMLLGLFLLWMRSAVLIWALFFGVNPFPGTQEILPMLFFTPTGWALLLIGGSVGGLFAAFGFAISVFAVPMLLQERTDALSALGISIAMVWANLPVMVAWGAVVLVLFTLSVATGFIGLIVVFPVLGHATWHAYRAIRTTERQTGEAEPMFIQPA